VLKRNGVRKGDRVADLFADGAGGSDCDAGLREGWRGAFGVFGGFSAQSVADRINDRKRSCDYGRRVFGAEGSVPLKQNVERR